MGPGDVFFVDKLSRTDTCGDLLRLRPATPSVRDYLADLVLVVDLDFAAWRRGFVVACSSAANRLKRCSCSVLASVTMALTTSNSSRETK